MPLDLEVFLPIWQHRMTVSTPKALGHLFLLLRPNTFQLSSLTPFTLLAPICPAGGYYTNKAVDIWSHFLWFLLALMTIPGLADCSSPPSLRPPMGFGRPSS